MKTEKAILVYKNFFCTTTDDKKKATYSMKDITKLSSARVVHELGMKAEVG